MVILPLLSKSRLDLGWACRESYARLVVFANIRVTVTSARWEGGVEIVVDAKPVPGTHRNIVGIFIRKTFNVRAVAAIPPAVIAGLDEVVWVVAVMEIADIRPCRRIPVARGVLPELHS